MLFELYKYLRGLLNKQNDTFCQNEIVASGLISKEEFYKFAKECKSFWAVVVIIETVKKRLCTEKGYLCFKHIGKAFLE